MIWGILAGTIAGGCSAESAIVLPKKDGSISGTVTWQQKPIARGVISFIPTAAGAAKANPTANVAGNRVDVMIFQGHYKVPNPPGLAAGSYKVEIRARDIPETPDGSDKSADIELDDLEYPEFIPAQYNDRTTLKANVASGTNTFDFHLTGEKRPATAKKKIPPRQTSSGAR
jgi:hypothetical protein